MDGYISRSDDGKTAFPKGVLAAFAPRREPVGAGEQSESGSVATKARLSSRLVQNPLRRCTKLRRTRASLPEIRVLLSRAWELLLAQRVGQAKELIDQMEGHLDDLPPMATQRLNAATQLLRAASLAFEGQWLAAFTLAQVHLDRNGASHGAYVALTLYRMGLWKLARHDAFRALPRPLPRSDGSHSEATSAAFDLSIEAALAIDHLGLTTAKRLATDALNIFETSRASRAAAGEALVMLPLSLIAQVHYEQGDLNEAERLIGDRLPLVDSEGSIESALRSYLVLARIARHRTHYGLASILLRGGEALGERRGWPRLIVACVAERISLLLEIGRLEEARLSLDHCDHYSSQASVNQQERLNGDIAHDWTLARCRLSWAEAPSKEAASTFRQLYLRAVEFGTPYAGCRLAAEYAAMLASIGETEEADALFLSAIKFGTSAGLYQPFVEGGPTPGAMHERIYQDINNSASADRELLPLLGSLLFQWRVRREQRQRASSASANGNTLTRRELDILSRFCHGLTNKSIARALDISPETVKSHTKRIFIKLGVSTRSEAVSRSKSLGLL